MYIPNSDDYRGHSVDWMGGPGVSFIVFPLFGVLYLESPLSLYTVCYSNALSSAARVE